jgi:hypothetical protein
MNRPTFGSLRNALLVSCAICALPSVVMSLAARSPVPLIVFTVLAVIHGLFLGIPAFLLLYRLGAANVVFCTLAGAAVGALPMAILLAGASGPGARYGTTVLLGALSGLAMGFLFWLCMAKAGERDPT